MARGSAQNHRVYDCDTFRFATDLPEGLEYINLLFHFSDEKSIDNYISDNCSACRRFYCHTLHIGYSAG